MAGSIPNEFIDHRKERIDIYEVISPRVTLKKAGKDYSGLCPFHNENSPSFTVSQQKQFYHCFGCGKNGSAIGFLMEYEGFDFIDAIKDLAQIAGLEVPQTGVNKNFSENKNLFEITEKANRYFKNNLKKSDPIIQYLKNRKITGQTSQTFQLGYAEEKWDGLIKQFSAEQQAQLITAGLAVQNDNRRIYDKFRQRLIFPIHDKRGRTIAFGGRAIAPDQKPKYLNSPETPLFHKGRELYGYHLARKHSQSEKILVVEGYMDVISLHQQGFANAVATLGTATSQEHIISLFRGWNTIVFCFDGDNAGRQAASKALFIALPLYRDDKSISFLFLPDGEDPDSYTHTHGSAAFEQLIDTAQPLSEFFIQTQSEGINLESLDGKARFYERCTAHINTIPEGAFKQLLMQKISEITHIQQGQNKPIKVTQTQLGKEELGHVKKLMSILLQQPQSVEFIPEDMHWQTISGKGIEIIQKIIEICRNNPHITTASVIENFRETPLYNKLGTISSTLSNLNDEEKKLELHDLVDYFQHKIRFIKIERLKQLMKKQGETGLSTEQKQELVLLLSQQNKQQEAQ